MIQLILSFLLGMLAGAILWEIVRPTGRKKKTAHKWEYDTPSELESVDHRGIKISETLMRKRRCVVCEKAQVNMKSIRNHRDKWVTINHGSEGRHDRAA